MKKYSQSFWGLFARFFSTCLMTDVKEYMLWVLSVLVWSLFCHCCQSGSLPCATGHNRRLYDPVLLDRRCDCSSSLCLPIHCAAQAGEVLVTLNDFIQCAIFLGVLILLAKPLGIYMARVFDGRSVILNRWLAPLERLVYRASAVNPDEGMGWKKYAMAMMVFNIIGILTVYLAAEPGGDGGGVGGFSFQYGSELRD
jgi:hypothetical protein